jgi:hypothetical protein
MTAVGHKAEYAMGDIISVVNFTVDAVNRHLRVRRNLRF